MIQLISQDEMVTMSYWKEITKAYKYEMRPTKKQEVLLNQTLSICRHLYNDSLAERKMGWENGGWNVGYSDQQDYLPELKKRNKELDNVQSQVLQNVLKRVDIAYQNFFRRVKQNRDNRIQSGIENKIVGEYKKPGFPRFKGYGRYDSFTFSQYGNGCDIGGKNNNILRLSKIGEIKFIKHRSIGNIGVPYQIKTVTIKKDVDKWFVSFTIKTFADIEIPTEQHVKENGIKIIDELNQKCIGIDLGLRNLTVLSVGKRIEPTEYLRESENILAKHQRRLSRKKREEKEIVDQRETKKQKKEIKKKIKVNSKNREKERIKVAKIHRTIVNQRRNFSHNISRFLVNNFDMIAFEKLNIQRMVQNHRLAKSISDASWYQLQMFTSYKAEWAGKIVEFVDSKNTSQICSRCGNKEHLELSDRIFKCSRCNLEIDRDLNASINIRNRSIEYQRRLKDIELINKSTLATGGRACLNSPKEKDVMIQEALSDKDGVSIENTSIQAPPFRVG